MRKAGRYTAALLLIAVGAAVIMDRFLGMSLTALLIDWWPVLFISLGLEYILLNMKYGESEKQLRLDLGGVIFAVLISAVVIGSTQSGTTFNNWFSSINFGQSFGNPFTSGEGRKFQKETILIPAGSNIDSITLENDTNGNVTIVSGSNSQVQIEATVYVALDDEQEAANVANESKVKSSISGQTLKLTAEGKNYGNGFWSTKRPQMDVVITVPAQLQAKMDIEMTNGRLKADQLVLRNSFKVRNTNGEIQLTGIEADIDMESTNARVTTMKTKGKMKLQTTNGSIEVADHQGDVQLESTNGGFTVAGVTGVIIAETTNGSINITEAQQALTAETTNGTIEVTSHAVNGNWDLKTNHGDLNLALPASGDYRVKGETRNGHIQNSLPLQIRKNSIEGSIGGGKHHINLDTRGSITIRAAN
jgi:DUF4097 and DUF4098 domain-containing protein YvlB